MIKNFARLLFITAITGAGAGPISAQSIPDDLLGQTNRIDDLQVENTDADFPIFPRIGPNDAPVTVDYFYSYDCQQCAQTSRSLYRIMSKGMDFEIVFHPISETETSYEKTMIGNVVYATEPSLFELYHFGLMAAQINEIDLDHIDLTLDLIARSDKSDLMISRIENPESWTAALDVNQDIYDQFDKKDLPILIINDKKYHGFPGEEALEKEIITTMGETVRSGLSSQ